MGIKLKIQHLFRENGDHIGAKNTAVFVVVLPPIQQAKGSPKMNGWAWQLSTQRGSGIGITHGWTMSKQEGLQRQVLVADQVATQN